MIRKFFAALGCAVLGAAVMLLALPLLPKQLLPHGRAETLAATEAETAPAEPADEPFDEAVMDRIVRLAQPDYIRGVTYLGGEPFDPRNQAGLLELSEKLRAAYPQKSIWSFTGYVYGKNLPQVPGVTDALLASLDVLVDGPFIEEQKNLRLRFRGSENQRLIDMPQTLKAGTVVLWDEEQ